MPTPSESNKAENKCTCEVSALEFGQRSRYCTAHESPQPTNTGSVTNSPTSPERAALTGDDEPQSPILETNKENDMDDQEMDYKDKLHDLRVQIDRLINYSIDMKNDSRPQYTKGKRELALVHTKLQEAKMWVGKVLEENDSPLPPEYRDEA